MDTQKIVAEIDAELTRLQQVKALLTGTTTAQNRTARRNSMAGTSGKRTLSADARERIAAAQRARWAKSKKTGKKVGVTPRQCQPARKPLDPTLLQKARKGARRALRRAQGWRPGKRPVGQR